MVTQCSLDVKSFIAMVRRQAETNTPYRRSEAQNIKLIIQLNKALTHDEEQPERKVWRVPVLQAITGDKLLDPSKGKASQNMLSLQWHSALIDVTEGGKSDGIIREIARTVEADSMEQPWELFSKTW
jgi:hypothetical protein